eukprot:4509703-Pleurochrysis_carterae.AAC.1
MLLGANSLREHGLVVDARIMAIYPGENKKPPPKAIKMFQGSHFNEEAGVCLYQSHAGNALYAVKPDSDELLATIPCERGDAEIYGLTPSVSVAKREENKESTRKNRGTKLSKNAGGGSSSTEGGSSSAGGGSFSAGGGSSSAGEVSHDAQHNATKSESVSNTEIETETRRRELQLWHGKATELHLTSTKDASRVRFSHTQTQKPAANTVQPYIDRNVRGVNRTLEIKPMD